MKNKGSSHVEIIISFVIFIGFLLFFYIVISPAIKGPRSDETILEDAKDRIITYISEEVEEHDLRIRDEMGKIMTCIKMPNDISRNVTIKEGGITLLSDYDIETENGDGLIETSHFLIIKKFDKEKLNEGLKLYSSYEFNRTDSLTCSETILPECGNIEPCYSLTFQKKREHIFESKMDELKEKYKEQLSGGLIGLRTVLKIPNKYEFWFDVLEEDGETSIWEDEGWEDQIDIESENIYVGEIGISYIDKETQDPENKKQGYLEIKIWG